MTLEVTLKLFISKCCDVPVRSIWRPSTTIFSGASALRLPLTLICNCTVSPTAASELLSTAVTLGESANAHTTTKNPSVPTKSARQTVRPRRLPFMQTFALKIDMGNQPSTFSVPTSRYRHGARPCVHQVGRAPLHLSSIGRALQPGVRSFDLPSLLRPRRPGRFSPEFFLICLRLPLSRRPRIFSAATPME